MRIGIFDNLANSAYIQAKLLNRVGQSADLVLDPLDRYVMSDPRWEDLDIELPTDELIDPVLPESQLPEWVRNEPGVAVNAHPTPPQQLRRGISNLRAAIGLRPAAQRAVRRAGWRGAWMVGERAWVIRALADYDCVIAYGAGPVWAALAGVPCIAETWGGDITMLPFYDTDEWEGHDAIPLPGPRRALAAQAKLQRMAYEHAGRILITDPRFLPFAERLGQAKKCVHLGFFVDVEKYRPQPEEELRKRLLNGAEGLIVFVPSRQDWYWKGSDRLLRGFAQVAEEYPDAVLVCAGWGADLDRSRELIGDLGIAGRVRLLPCAMSKERLRRYYCAADIVADQFTVGSYGGSALEAMSCARPVLISLDRERFAGVFPSFPPVMNVSAPDQIAAALRDLLGNAGLRAELGAEAREWVTANHGTSLAERVIELANEVVAETAARSSAR
jgi:glycosyltransferase involved in cell wall biosynthesis